MLIQSYSATVPRGTVTTKELVGLIRQLLPQLNCKEDWSLLQQLTPGRIFTNNVVWGNANMLRCHFW